MRRGNIKDGADIHHLDEGKCVVADLLNCRLVIFAKYGKCITTVQNDDIVEPWGLAVHENSILVTSLADNNHMILCYSYATWILEI
jgi:hypothetical protein